MPLPKEEQRYTYADYCTWDDSGRWELIDGVPYAMSPAPAWEHQGILTELLYKLRSFLEGKPCKVFAAPFDVRLNTDGYDDTVVQPDLVVVCDKSKLSSTGCSGAPDMVIEILSPSTVSHDKVLKFNLYQETGVREYWIVDPERRTVSANVLINGRYEGSDYNEADSAPVYVLEGCKIDLADIFAV